MTRIRKSSTLAIIGILVLGLFAGSYATCFVTATANCCDDEHECEIPACANGALCHCACAYSGVLPVTDVHQPIPLISGQLGSESDVACVPHISNDLFRPPRLV